jgi:hypothetical protein
MHNFQIFVVRPLKYNRPADFSVHINKLFCVKTKIINSNDAFCFIYEFKFPSLSCAKLLDLNYQSSAEISVKLCGPTLTICNCKILAQTIECETSLCQLQLFFVL